MTVRIEDDGPVRTVTIDRSERRNAVVLDTAEALRAEAAAGAARFTGGEGRGGRFD